MHKGKVVELRREVEEVCKEDEPLAKKIFSECDNKSVTTNTLNRIFEKEIKLEI